MISCMATAMNLPFSLATVVTIIEQFKKNPKSDPAWHGVKIAI